ncbi:response regulator [Serratia marcescens]|uniref:sigma 54-interacting transcriptional regulator n=2 Tax=Serratia marcescens TaxID=615 RepID=UPI000F7E615F|nr:sigma 54-interacting transcriptional regulator [Serratia marcescens]RTF99347.1 response regulator [Serratia marcescens]
MTARKPANLLLVDDDPSLLKLLGMRLTSEGFHVTTAESGQEALRLLAREQIDLVISDLRMDEMDGMALFAEIQKHQPGMPVIILTAHGSIPDAVAATQQGVFSFLTKPVDRDALYKAIDEALALSASPAGDDAWREDIVTRSPLMLRLLEQVKMVAQSDVSVLINGQSGTGKEVVAQAIHAASPRASKAFIAINCGALPEQLLESELFGHAKGAFTGAVSSREGLFQAAAGGTLFLDEIGDMPLDVQTRLLRVLQEKTVTPLGSRSAYPVEFALVCATHHDLHRQVEAGAFREDLLYRIQEYSLRIPPLRERAQLEAFILQLWRELGGERRDIRLLPEALAMLARYPWPGNVRQLLSTLKVLLALADDHAVLTLDDLPQSIAVLAPRQENADTDLGALQAAIDRAGGNLSRAAKALGVSRSTLYRKLGRQKTAAE